MAKEKKELDRFDTKSRRNMPIVVKLLSVIIASVIVSVVGVALLTGIEMSLVRENLENGNIDAAENNWPTYQSTGDYTVAKYFVLDQHTRVPEMVIASKKVLFGKVKILAGLFLFRNNPEKFIFVI